MKFTKKLFALLLALALCLSLGVCALAVEEDAETADTISAVESFTKTYTTAGGSGLVAAPAETLTFTVKNTGAPEKFTGDADALLVVGEGNTFYVDGETDTYTIPLTFNSGSTEGLAVGLYYFTVTETNTETSQGVSYGTGDAGKTLYVTVLVEHSADDYNTLVASIYLTDSTYTLKYTGLENSYSLGSLTVSKTVSGNLSDTSDVFLVDVTFSSGNPVNSVISYSGAVATDTTAESGTVTLALGETNYTTTVTIAVTHNSEVVFTDIPAGVGYVVQEHDYTQGDINAANDGYDSPVYTISDESTNVLGTGADQIVSGTIQALDEDAVAINNPKGIEVKTGVSLESLPYILVLVAVVAVAVVLIIRKRRVED